MVLRRPAAQGGKLGKAGADAVVVLRAVGEQAGGAVLDAAFRVLQAAAAALAEGVERAEAEQTVEVLRIVRLVARKVFAFPERYGYSELAAEQKLLTGGYKIYATIDPEVQAIVDKVYENLDNVPKTVSVQQLQSAIVVTDNKTGDIVAMAGGVGDKGGSLTLNRATQSKQPAGSSFKPVAVYAPALDAGIITPATVYEDSPLNEDRNWPRTTPDPTAAFATYCAV